jgi:hypothetical protein
LQRVLVGLLAAYAASMTLYASQWAAEAWVFRHFYQLAISGSDYDRPEGHSLLRIARDFGWERTRMETFSLWVADLRAPVLVPAVIVLFLLGLGAGLIRLPSRTHSDKD